MKKIVSTIFVLMLIQLILLCPMLQANSQVVDSQIPTQLTTDTNTDQYPAALRDNTGKIWVFFESDRLGGSPSAIWYRTSVDDGENWSDPQLLVPCMYPTSNDIPPAPGHFSTISAMQDSTGKIWVVFGSTSPPDGRGEVWFMTSEDGGNSWSNPKKPYEICSPWPHYSSPAVVEGFGKIWIIFHGWSTGEETGFKYVSSDDGGLTWSSLANFPAGRHVNYPQAIRDASDNIWVFYSRQPDWNTGYARNISYVRSNDGVTWSEPCNIEEMGPGSENYPWGTQESSGRITVFFDVTIDGVACSEIFYVNSYDDGATWSDPEQFTEDPNRDWDPTVLLTDEGLLVFWVSDRSGNWDIWLARFEVPILTALIDIDPDTLNLKSNGEFVTVYIELPEGYNVEDIVLATVKLDGISAAWSEIQNGVYMVKFDRATVQTCLTSEPDYDSAPKFYDLPLAVTGELVDGTPFEGSDTIRVLSK